MVIKAYAPLSTRIAEEMQLLAEEKWIIEALTLIRKERNAMQIERLELESAKLLLQRIGQNASGPECTATAPTQSEPAPLPQATNEEGSPVEIMINSQAGVTLAELEQALPQGLVDDGFCNNQQLNLTVTNSIFDLDNTEIEEEEEEEEESDGSDDEESPDSIFMDMNMFMNSNKNW